MLKPITPNPTYPSLICVTRDIFNFLKKWLKTTNDGTPLVKGLGGSFQVLKSYHSEQFKNWVGSCHTVQSQ